MGVGRRPTRPIRPSAPVPVNQLSDQYTGWLHCRPGGDQIDTLRGRSKLEGWAVLPSAVGEYMNEVPGFIPIDPLVQAPWADLFDAIQGLIDNNA
jgi:hypothetical protein